MVFLAAFFGATFLATASLHQHCLRPSYERSLLRSALQQMLFWQQPFSEQLSWGCFFGAAVVAASFSVQLFRSNFFRCSFFGAPFSEQLFFGAAFSSVALLTALHAAHVSKDDNTSCYHGAFSFGFLITFSHCSIFVNDPAKCIRVLQRGPSPDGFSFQRVHVNSYAVRSTYCIIVLPFRKDQFNDA